MKKPEVVPAVTGGAVDHGQEEVLPMAQRSLMK
jgi:hypothetical protein